jgi:hypothetical protein
MNSMLVQRLYTTSSKTIKPHFAFHAASSTSPNSTSITTIQALQDQRLLNQSGIEAAIAPFVGRQRNLNKKDELVNTQRHPTPPKLAPIFPLDSHSITLMVIITPQKIALHIFKFYKYFLLGR